MRITTGQGLEICSGNRFGTGGNSLHPHVFPPPPFLGVEQEQVEIEVREQPERNPEMPNRDTDPVEQHEVLTKLRQDHADAVATRLEPAILDRYEAQTEIDAIFYETAAEVDAIGFTAEVYETVCAFPGRTRAEILELVRQRNPKRTAKELRAAITALVSPGVLHIEKPPHVPGEPRRPSTLTARYWPVAG